MCREGVFVFAVELGGVDKVVLVGSCYLWCGGAGGAEIRVVCTVSAIMPRHMTVGDAQGGGAPVADAWADGLVPRWLDGLIGFGVGSGSGSGPIRCVWAWLIFANKCTDC